MVDELDPELLAVLGGDLDMDMIDVASVASDDLVAGVDDAEAEQVASDAVAAPAEPARRRKRSRDRGQRAFQTQSASSVPVAIQRRPPPLRAVRQHHDEPETGAFLPSRDWTTQQTAAALCKRLAERNLDLIERIVAELEYETTVELADRALETHGEEVVGTRLRSLGGVFIKSARERLTDLQWSQIQEGNKAFMKAHPEEYAWKVRRSKGQRGAENNKTAAFNGQPRQQRRRQQTPDTDGMDVDGEQRDPKRRRL